MKNQFSNLSATSLISILLVIFSYKTYGSTQTINQYDTVYFDLGNAIVAGNYFELPVFIKSDDVINSLDFSMKFDLGKLQYDSLVILHPTMSPLASYNSNDSTLRLTSFDLQAIPNDVFLVRLRFHLLAGTQITKSDFNSLTALLNGDPCTPYILINNPSTSINRLLDDRYFLNVYPNPSTGIVSIETTHNSAVTIFDNTGRFIQEINSGIEQKIIFNFGNIPTGEYLFVGKHEDATCTKRITFLK